ncbi:MAG: HYC_CC_PP family protein [Candidatus Cyclobacteriaceae bacterium M2_1C_046]
MQRFRKISTIMLSALVLLNSMSFTFSMHFCMGQLESIALFSGAEPCEMATQKSPCANDKHDPDCEPQQVTKKGCCEDQTLVIEGHEDLTLLTKVAVPDFQMIAVIYAVVSFLFSDIAVDHYTFNDYSPPLIERDIPVLVQSFLI